MVDYGCDKIILSTIVGTLSSTKVRTIVSTLASTKISTTVSTTKSVP